MYQGMSSNCVATYSSELNRYLQQPVFRALLAAGQCPSDTIKISEPPPNSVYPANFSLVLGPLISRQPQQNVSHQKLRAPIIYVCIRARGFFRYAYIGARVFCRTYSTITAHSRNLIRFYLRLFYSRVPLFL